MTASLISIDTSLTSSFSQLAENLFRYWSEIIPSTIHSQIPWLTVTVIAKLSFIEQSWIIDVIMPHHLSRGWLFSNFEREKNLIIKYPKVILWLYIYISDGVIWARSYDSYEILYGFSCLFKTFYLVWAGMLRNLFDKWGPLVFLHNKHQTSKFLSK